MRIHRRRTFGRENYGSNTLFLMSNSFQNRIDLCYVTIVSTKFGIVKNFHTGKLNKVSLCNLADMTKTEYRSRKHHTT